MGDLFRVKTPDAKTPPSKDDERQRQLGMEARKPKGGTGTTLLTRGLATPALRPAGAASAPTILTG